MALLLLTQFSLVFQQAYRHCQITLKDIALKFCREWITLVKNFVTLSQQFEKNFYCKAMSIDKHAGLEKVLMCVWEGGGWAGFEGTQVFVGGWGIRTCNEDR